MGFLCPPAKETHSVSFWNVMFSNFPVTASSTWGFDVSCGADFLRAPVSQAVESQGFTESNVTQVSSEKTVRI